MAQTAKQAWSQAHPPTGDEIGLVTRPIASDLAGRQQFFTVFGEGVVAFHEDNISCKFHYNNSARDVKTAVLSGSGVISNAARKAVVSIGASAGSAGLQSVASVRYRPGHEALGQWTSKYEGPQAGVNHYHGFLNGSDGAAFGYKDGVFGVWFIESGVETHVAQADWSEDDKLDGNGATGFNLNPEKFNLYMTSYGWLGIAPIIYFVYCGRRIGWRVAHVIDRVNQDDDTHLDNPTLPIQMRVTRASGSGSAAAIRSSSWRGGVSAGERTEANHSDRWFSETRINMSISSGSGRTNIFAIANLTTIHSKENHVPIELGVVRFTNNGNKDFAFYGTKVSSGDITGVGSSYAVNSADSCAQILWGGAINSGAGSRGPATVLSPSDSERADVRGTGIIIYPGEIFAFEGVSDASYNGTVSLAVRWLEKF